ncbi:MAG: hypothetical protein RL220_1105, partial [Bacteroidota bacterium]
VDADDLMAAMKNEARDVAAEQGKLDDLNDSEKDEVYHKVGMSALKYFLLRVDPVKNMVFNPRESIDFNGHTGPFIQYGFVRTQAIRRRYNELGGEARNLQIPSTLHDAEKGLIRKLYEYPEMINEAATRYNPSVLANYAYELVKDFNTFYHECPVLREEDADRRHFRVVLSDKTGEVVQSAMNLLGIGMVAKM